MAIIRAKNEADYIFKAGSYTGDKLRVVRFFGTEGISELFHFSVDLASTDGEVDFEKIVGQPALLTIHGEKGKRYINGLVNLFEQVGKDGKWTLYRAGIVPAAWTLSQRATCRIFQNQSVPDIIKKVLTEAGIASDQLRLSFKKSYNPREYCVQYRESDLSFVTRLMEQNGIFYFFEHAADKHVMVLGDDPVVHVAIAEPAKVIYRPPTGTGVSDQEHISVYQFHREIRTGAVRLRDFDFKKPRLSLEKDAKAKGDGNLEAYDYPGEYLTPDEGGDLSKVRLEELQAARQVGSGQSDCRRFIPGFRFTLEQHDRSSFNREYLLTRVSHNGSQTQVLGAETAGKGGGETSYQNRIDCIPSDVSFRAPRVTPKPAVQGPQTAIVVGPKGEEIYTDEHGRVKVQFHWDREGKQDEKSSCWIRVSQAWAGAGWGAMFIPRIGQEVIVEFLEGDPDQPIVTGKVYNGDNKPPYQLPGEKTKSTLKSNSSKGGEGSNEIRFEDKKGDEQIFLHGEKNVDVRVKNDIYEWVGRNRHLIVKQDQIEHVENTRQEKVDQDHVEQIGRDRHLRVKGKEATEIGGSRSLTVKGDVIEVFKGDHSEKTSGDYYLKASNLVIEAMSNITLKVGGSYIAIEATGITIKGSATMEVKGMQVTVKADATLELEGTGSTNVKSGGMTTVKGSIVQVN
jgi:type VI secretion system secreted protein VgrG